MNKLFDLIRVTADRFGLNLIAAIPTVRYDLAVKLSGRVSNFVHEAPSIIVLGNGGRRFWQEFNIHAAANADWKERENPLDDFTRLIVEEKIATEVRALGIRCDAVYPFVSGAPALNFMELGRVAGLGAVSIVGVLVHPIYGPWIAFRAALMINEVLDLPGPALNFDPCPACKPRSCITACPASAVSFSERWSLGRCVEHRVEVEADCASRCHARVACVLSPEHRYSDDELAYHQDRALRAMRPWYLAQRGRSR